MSRRSQSPWWLLALPLAFLVAACSEDLETGGACPALCPGQQLTVLDTVLEPAYVFDSSVVGFPSIGLELPLLLASRGDTLDLRAVVRFDSIPRRFRPTPADTLRPILSVDSAWMDVRLRGSGLPVPSEFYVDAYDIYDPSQRDTVPGDVLPFFTPARLLGTYAGTSAFVDSLRVRIPLDTAKLRAIITDSTRFLRIGLQVRSPESVQLALSPFELESQGPAVEYWVVPDSFVGRIRPDPYSVTPRSPLVLTEDLTDYTVIAAAPDISAPGRIVVGGFPAARSFIRFDLPRWVTDSVGLLRAQLEFVQDPVYGLASSDTVTINTHLVVAGAPIDDPRRASTLLAPGDLFTTALRLVPSDSGTVLLELNRLIRQWRTSGGLPGIPRAIVLRSFQEAAAPAGIRFFGLNAADPALRPRLRISYTPQQVFGRP